VVRAGQPRDGRSIAGTPADLRRSQPGDPLIIQSITSPISSVTWTASANTVLEPPTTSSTAPATMVPTRAVANGSNPNARCGRHAE
jgi:hypothetical protein